MRFRQPSRRCEILWLRVWLYTLSPACFAHCRLQLSCVIFPVTEVRQQRGPAEETPRTYGFKAQRFHDPLTSIISDEKLVQFSQKKPTRQIFFLVRPWDSRLLDLPNFCRRCRKLGRLVRTFSLYSTIRTTAILSKGNWLIENPS
ncbi:hypothetical protein C8R48DRAFT_143318 [Suillus tomentosus]|nr:hypothetical protein C8R48DRAFT_143318 [Suillus tomentosus]